MDQHHFTLISGASSGIGRETAIRLSTSQPLILHGRDAARLEETRGLCSRSELHVLWNLELREVNRIEESLRQVLEKNRLAVARFVHCVGMLILMDPATTERVVVQET